MQVEQGAVTTEMEPVAAVAATRTSFVVALVGVDGCGKTSTFHAALDALAATRRVVGIGDEVLSASPTQAPRERLDIPSSRFTRALGRFVKGVRWQAVYKNLKFLELTERTRIREYVAGHDPPDVILTDGDPLVNTAAWAAARFYRRELAGDDKLLLTVLGHLTGEERIPMRELPRYLRRGWQMVALRLLRFGHFGYPDVIVLLEIDPAVAMARIRARGRPLQTHENEEFLRDLGAAYARVCDVLEAGRGVHVVRVRVDQNSLEDVAQHVVNATSEHPMGECQPSQPAEIEVVATTMSGSLQDQRKVDLIAPEFRARTIRSVHVAKAHSHAEAQAIAHDVVARGGRILVSAGGAGTFNAVLEGAHLNGSIPSDLRLAFLRKGSADLIGKALGIPDQLPLAAAAILGGIETGCEIAADILELQAVAPDGRAQIRHIIGFGGFGIFGEIPRFTETRLVKLYKGVLGSLFGDLGPFFIGLPLAIASWQVQRFLGRAGRTALRLDAEEIPPEILSTVLILNGDLGTDFPLGRGLPLSSGAFRVVALRYRGLAHGLKQMRACRNGRILDDPQRYAAIVRTVHSLVMRPESRHPFMVNVDGLRVHARGEVQLAVSGQVRLVAAPGPAR